MKIGSEERRKVIAERMNRIRLGDAVAMVAQPIAKAIDAVAHTNLQNCGGCKKRREMLNRIRLL